MARDSVSFRITRNTEDLAQTIHTLSQRVVKLEQRLAAMELQLDRRDDADPTELTSLDNVERLLDDCRQLLELTPVESAPNPGPAAEASEADLNGEQGGWAQAA